MSELSIEERLEDLPRPGTPPRITADQRCQLEALACAAPEKHGRPISQWSSREIADEVITVFGGGVARNPLRYTNVPTEHIA